MTVGTNNPWLRESPIDQLEGSDIAIAYTIVFNGYTTVTVNNIKVFKDGEDVTATCMPSGSHVPSGNRLTMKPLTALEYPAIYVVKIAVDVDGQDDGWKLKVRSVSESAEN